MMMINPFRDGFDGLYVENSSMSSYKIAILSIVKFHGQNVRFIMIKVNVDKHIIVPVDLCHSMDIYY